MLLFVLGLLVGTLVALRLGARRRASQRGREQQAVMRAEARLRTLEAAALGELAEVGQLVPRQPLAPVTSAAAAEIVGAHVAAVRLDMHWRRVGVPGTTCSGLLAEPIASPLMDSAHESIGPSFPP